MFTISPISKYRCHFLQIGFIAITLLTTSLISLEAHAEANRRVCVSQGGNQAIKITKGYFQKVLCEQGRGRGDSWRSGVSLERLGPARTEHHKDFGRGVYKTCEEFSTTDLGWGGDDEVVVDPCPAMHFAGSASLGVLDKWRPEAREIYFVKKIPFNGERVSGGPCGGSSCTLTYSFSESSSITYSETGGFTAGPISGSISFSQGTSTTWGASRSDSWLAGHTPGLALNVSTLEGNRGKYRTFNDLESEKLDTYIVHTKGWSALESGNLNRERRHCTNNHGIQYHHVDHTHERTQGVMMDLGIAQEVFKLRNTELDERYNLPKLISGGCGVYLTPAWPHDKWRTTDDMYGLMMWVVKEDIGMYGW